MFGLWAHAPESGLAWGARAIFNRGEIDLLWDRQSFRDDGEHQFNKDMFMALVNMLLAKARGKARDLQFDELAPDSCQVVTLAEANGIVLKGSTNSSFGYLYLIAYYDEQWFHDMAKVDSLTWQVSAFRNFRELEISIEERGYVPTLRVSEEASDDYKHAVLELRRILKDRGHAVHPHRLAEDIG
jgi:hypothetical protein